MGATKESPAYQVLEWAVGKLDEASKVDWVEKFSTLTASQPAYLRNGADLDAAVARAGRAEAKAQTLAERVADLEQQLAALNSHDDVELPAESDEDQHKHWWSRH
jgi:hypothetical protein